MVDFRIVSMLSHSQFQATSCVVSQTVGRRDRKAASMQDLNSDRLTQFTPAAVTFAIRIETRLHSCCRRLMSAICSTIEVKLDNISCIHLRPDKPITAQFHWNISVKVLGTSAACSWDLPDFWVSFGLGSLFSFLMPSSCFSFWFASFPKLQHLQQFSKVPKQFPHRRLSEITFVLLPVPRTVCPVFPEKLLSELSGLSVLATSGSISISFFL
mmetsp:Transcript_33986/g.79148  ORF Transcript_33986/g.79148 Transcript_33986/m.79148 type:complete len:213 (+) Transcript_33986:2196-2834(+)